VNALIAVSVGNSRTQIGRFSDLAGDIDASESVPNSEMDMVLERISHHLHELEGHDPVVVMASVNRSVSDPLRARAEGKFDLEISVIGEDIMPAVRRGCIRAAEAGVCHHRCGNCGHG
jgi:hypothetical protein